MMPRRLFAGANTAHGFVSLYDQIMPKDKAERVYVLKGGPGVGKSTLMKKAAKALEEAGADVEYFHCSGDPGSLDAVSVFSAGLAILDGTAPHVTDPALPGVAHHLINLASFLDEGALSKKKSAIFALTHASAPHYARAYRYLNAAETLRRDTSICLKEHMHEKALSDQMRAWTKSLLEFSDPMGKGRIRRLFAGAVTVGRCIDFLETLSPRIVWRLRGRWGFPTEDVLEFLAQNAALKGMDALHLLCPLNATRLEHLYFPKIGLLITTDNCFHSISAAAQKDLDVDELLSLDYPSREALSFNRREFDRLLQGACDEIQKAHALHQELEAEYTPCMDFPALERLSEKIQDEALSILEHLRYDEREENEAAQ